MRNAMCGVVESYSIFSCVDILLLMELTTNRLLMLFLKASLLWMNLNGMRSLKKLKTWLENYWLLILRKESLLQKHFNILGLKNSQPLKK
jgi:hypothetical protein